MKINIREAFQKAAQYPYKQKAVQLVCETPIEVGIGALVLGAAFGISSYHKNLDREGHIPTAFSEIEATVRQYKQQGASAPALTKIYSECSDVPMKVFESSNIAHSRNILSFDKIFASELETRVDHSLRIYHLVSEYAQEVPGDTYRALQSLDKLVQEEKEIPAVISALSKSWEEDHDDVYHTEFYTTEECDSKGNCHSEMHTRQVYDYTVHTYTYHKQAGEKAAVLLGDFLQKHPDLHIDEQLIKATQTGADNEYAMETSMKELLKSKIPTPEQSLTFANTWATASNLTKYQPVILSNHAAMTKLSPAWTVAKGSAKNARYQTYSHSDAGPKEYQVAKGALHAAEAIYSSSRKITGGIAMCGAQVPVLNQQIKNYIGITLDSKKGDIVDARKAVMATARTIYEANYVGGLDLHPFKWGEVVLLTLGGMLLGGGLGFGADRYIDHRVKSKIKQRGYTGGSRKF